MDMMMHIFQVEGMHCGSCALLIDDTLEDLPGVRSSQTTVKRGRSTVELDTTRTQVVEVIDAITGLGYRATEVAP